VRRCYEAKLSAAFQGWIACGRQARRLPAKATTMGESQSVIAKAGGCAKDLHEHLPAARRK
jgi:hypothetical protein